MADKSGISWCDSTWNPTTGCDRVSPGCKNCYALTMAARLKAMGQARYQKDGDPKTSGPGFGLTMHEDSLYQPLKWKRPRKIFVNSMSDLFHPEVTDGFIARVWDVMGKASQHTFQILTKRPERMLDWVSRWSDRAGDGQVEFSGRQRDSESVRKRFTSGRALLFADMLDSMGEPPEGSAYPTYDWMEGWKFWPRVLPNVWLGTSVENARWRTRIDDLRQTPAVVRFLSCEPLLGPLVDQRRSLRDASLGLTGIDWVIIGGESGPNARPMELDWVRDIIDACRKQGAAPYVKQLGKVWAGRGHGADMEAWPEDLQAQEWPMIRWARRW